MNSIEEHFMKMTDNISFIELKENSYINLKGYIIKEHLPLPMVIDTLISELKAGNIYDELNVRYLIDGIIYTLGTDLDFKHKNEYIEILYHYDSKIEDYILYKGFEFIEKDNYDAAAVYFRALTNINSRNVNGVFNYALSLENLGKKFIDAGFQDKGKLFLMESTKQLEIILDIASDFPLAYYKLGYHYKYYGQFLKANLMWRKYLKLSDHLDRIEEIRKELELITDDSDFEQGVYYLNNGEYELALDKLLRLTDKYIEWGNLFYFTGLAFKGNGEYGNAIGCFQKAIELGEHNVDVYNELGISFYGIGDLNNALKIFSKGISINNEDYKTIFNRGMIYLQLGNLDKAIDDINKAYELNPNDIMIKNQKSELEELMGL